MGGFGVKTLKFDDWKTGPKTMEAGRKKWEKLVNAILPPQVKRVSRLSHRRANRGRIPRRHLGTYAWRQEKNGRRTINGDFNRLLDKLDALELEMASLETAERELTARSVLEEEAASALEPSIASTTEVPPGGPLTILDDHGLEPISRESLKRAVAATAPVMESDLGSVLDPTPRGEMEHPAQLDPAPLRVGEANPAESPAASDDRAEVDDLEPCVLRGTNPGARMGDVITRTVET